ncbi:DUF6580 family putative transport protein [Flavobacteriaceae bacterium SZ-1-7]|uniref:DUF6580 family putative transport protein n=1 Tax=Tamlana sedimenti TaxID=3134126 RepID=UPI00312458E3
MGSLFSKRQLIIIAFIAVAIIFRLVPHLPNVTPITAAALFSGVYFTDKKLAFIIPLLAMAISDIFLGFTLTSVFVYTALILVGLIGIYSKKMNFKSILISSISFFIITNLGVWLIWYPLNLNGLLECYTLAIPFFRNSLIGDFFFAGVLYFGFNFVSNRYLKVA